MFAQGATPGKVDMWSYHEDEEDFTKGIIYDPVTVFGLTCPTDATALDVWVLEQLRTLFHNATDNPVLTTQLHQEKTVFFLHLLGLDTTGHSYRPHSKVWLKPTHKLNAYIPPGVHDKYPSGGQYSTTNGGFVL